MVDFDIVLVSNNKRVTRLRLLLPLQRRCVTCTCTALVRTTEDGGDSVVELWAHLHADEEVRRSGEEDEKLNYSPANLRYEVVHARAYSTHDERTP